MTKKKAIYLRKLIVDGKILCVYELNQETRWMRDKTAFKGREIKRATRAEREKYLKKRANNHGS